MFRYAVILFVLFLNLFFLSNSKAQLVLNEVSQGTGNKEYAEFVVTGPFNCNPMLNCLDLRGWYLDDNNGEHAAGSGVGIAAGTFHLTQNQLWSCVPLGTIILIYNASDPPLNLPAAIDTSMNDGNCRLIFPILTGGGGTSGICNYIVNHATLPSSTNSPYPSGGFNTCPTNPDWVNVGMANGGDSFHSVDPSGNVVHAVSWGNNTLNNVIYFAGSAAGLVFNMENVVDNDPFNQANWTSNPIAGKETPGAPNNATNAAWLTYLSNSCTNRLAFEAMFNSTTPSCGACNGTITTIANNGFSPYTLSLNGVNQSSINLNNLCTGTYNLTITDSIGCSIDTSFTFNPSGSINITASINDSSLCAGDSTIINLTGATNYTWNPLTNITSVNDSVFAINPSSTTMYTFIAGGAQCGDTAIVNVIVNPLPNVDAGLTVNLCSGNVGNINASGAQTYSWTPSTGLSSSNISNPTVSVNTSTIYTLIGEENGCYNADTVGVYITQTPVITSGNDTSVCEFSSVNLFASGATTYSWLPANGFTGSANSSTSVNPVSSQIYSVVGFNGQCSDTGFVSVVVNQNPLASFNALSVCQGDSAFFLSNSIGNGLTYTWLYNGVNIGNNNQANTLPFNCGDNALALYIEDVNGCKDTLNSIYTVNCLPITNFGISDTVSCSSNAIQLSNFSLGNNGDTLYYNWNFGNSSTDTSKNPLATYISTGIYNITLITSTQFGCSDTMIKQVTIYSSPVISILGDTVCKGEMSTIQVNASNYSSSSVWTWNLGNGIIVNDTNQITYTYLTAQDYVVSLIITNPGGCADTAITGVSILNLPNPNFTTNNICLGQFQNFEIDQPENNTQYFWDFNNDGVVDFNGQQTTYQYTDTGTVNINVIGINTVGCSDTITKTLQVYPTPQPLVNPGITEICYPGCLTLSGDSLLTNNWYVNGIIKTGTETNWCLEEGTYDVKLISENIYGCTDSTAITNHLTFNPLPNATYSADPDEMELLDANPYFNVLNPTPGTYYFNFGDSAIIVDENLYNITHQYQDTGTYQTSLIIVSNNGCIDTATLDIKIKPDYMVYIPNAFTPNNDKFNNEFKIVANGFINEGFVFRVFDRWGLLMFETHDINKGWDGTFQNEKCPIDHYAYTVTILDYRRRSHEYVGTITLVR